MELLINFSKFLMVSRTVFTSFKNGIKETSKPYNKLKLKS
jgi:hypothetical protein